MRFEAPWAFLALLVVPAIILYRTWRGRPGTLRFSSLANARRAGESLRARLGFLPLALRIAAVVLLVTAIARPQRGHERIKEVTKGIAIEMVVDRSGSMGAEMDYRGVRLNRLGAVKKVFEEFLTGNGKNLAGRPSDLVGMVAFARYADTMAPLTLAHGALLRFIESVQVVTRENEDGTSIGDAIALAAARLKTAEEEIAKRAVETGSAEYTVKSKVLILLTDGQNNYGRYAPEDAAALAAGWGVKIYAIGVGGRESVTTVRTLFGNFKVPGGPGVDEETLRSVAERTGGRAWLAEDEESLRQVYAEIDRLEKSEIESVSYVDYRELFWPFALAGLLVLAAETTIANTIFRRIP